MTKYTKEQLACNRELWYNALRSGKYKQGIGYLNNNGNFCCIGVACEVAIQNGLKMKVKIDKGGMKSYNGSKAMVPTDVFHWLGFKPEINRYIGKDASVAFSVGDTIVSPISMNDAEGLTFKQIANKMQELEPHWAMK